MSSITGTTTTFSPTDGSGVGIERVLRKLERFAPLLPEERAALLSALGGPRVIEAREDIIQERHSTEGVLTILEGIACRYKLLPDGRRQIVGFLMPGDFCDIRVFLLRRMDHSIATISAVTAATISPGAMMDLLARFPRLTRSLWWTTLVEDSITREWVVNVGYRTAFERVAHLFCEVFWRLESVGLTHGTTCRFPLTQIELGDTLALSSVHVNRTLMYMQRANLTRLHGGQLELLDREGLQRAAGFDPHYLHLDGGNPAAVSLQATPDASSGRPTNVG